VRKVKPILACLFTASESLSISSTVRPISFIFAHYTEVPILFSNNRRVSLAITEVLPKKLFAYPLKSPNYSGEVFGPGIISKSFKLSWQRLKKLVPAEKCFWKILTSTFTHKLYGIPEVLEVIKVPLVFYAYQDFRYYFSLYSKRFNDHLNDPITSPL